MYKTILISLLSTMFVACSSNSSLKYFKKEEIQARAIQYTKKTDILEKNEPKVLFIATYLNNIKSKQFKSKQEKFVISTYFTDAQEQDLLKRGYKLSLNDKEALQIKEINKNDPLYGPLLANNHWGKYYLVEFDEVKDVYELKLVLSKTASTSGQLKFEK